MNRNRRRFLATASVTGLAALALEGCTRGEDSTAQPPVHGGHGISENTAGLSPAQALAKITEGNARFVAMAEIAPNVSTTRLMAISRGQRPFVGVLGCVDSRVPPELIFDRGLGDIFDTRIAGAIADDAAIGSLEFGVEEFDVPLLVVLGHSRCGAVTAAVGAVDSGQTRLPGQIGAVVERIIPAVKSVQAQGATGEAVIDSAAREVVRRGVAALRDSPILRDRIDSGGLEVAAAFYDLDNGKVELLS